nr:hypothetical protein [Paenibacillus dendritiformis]
MAKLTRTLVLLSLIGGLLAGCGAQPPAASGKESAAAAPVSTSV